MTSTESELRASLSKLDLSSQTATSAKKGHAKLVVDSWEDDLSASSTDDEGSTDPKDAPISIAHSKTIKADGPNAPPPTPISPNVLSPVTSHTQSSRFAGEEPFVHPFGPGASGGAGGGGDAGRLAGRSGPGARPEKTDAVARRLIAGALGVRAPKRTEEQRAYDRAMREKEMKRREKEKEDARKAEEDRQKAIKAAWDD